jgi:hypothetical protein
VKIVQLDTGLQSLLDFPLLGGLVLGDSGATSIASVPQIERNIGLEKAVMLELSIMAQIRVKHTSPSLGWLVP